ncbi:hypothetical protein DASC09_039020 [Saccharomycopsis crataegensis]|uniref:Uncharacterized protein n=1 Tax=Saccharomycopsis crataegensis TaxID=43959 RepID=A0AAV5QPZ5_9ASCO|nr:hypothetical protein DASC09_039020 [Saccharomycopsis crataegensis]
MPESSFDVDVESSALKKPHHHVRRRSSWNRMYIYLLTIIFLSLTLFLLNSYNSRVFELSKGIKASSSSSGHAVDDSIMSTPNPGKVNNNEIKATISKEEDDEVASKNSKAAAAAAANIQYTTDKNGNGASSKLLMSDDLSNSKTVPKATKEINSEQQKIKQESVSNKENSVHNSEEVPAGRKKSGFDPSAEFKAIVALSPVVIFTWETNNPIPLSNHKTSSSSGSDDSSSYRASKDLLKTLGEHYQITPVPTYVSLDRHPHYKELAIYINSLYHKLNSKDTHSIIAPSPKTDSKPKSRAESLMTDKESINGKKSPEHQEEEASSYYSKRELEKSSYSLPELMKGENILPGIVIAGKPIGNSRQLKASHENGQLLSILKDFGAGIVNIERVG